MSRSVSRMTPILPYGLDLPFTAFSKDAHAQYKFNYVSERGGAAMKFLEKPVYIHTHATVRIPKDQYEKVTFSVTEEESSFVRLVEKDIMDSLDRIVDMAEPSLNVQLTPFKSATYENLVKVKINKTVGFDKNNVAIPSEKHQDVLVKGVKVLMTMEIHGLYHSSASKGVIARVHGYRVVDSFDA